MPIQTTDLDAIPNYTVTQRLKAAYAAQIQILTGAQSYGENGRSVQKAMLDSVNRTIADLEDQLAVEQAGTAAAGGDVLVITGEPQ